MVERRDIYHASAFLRDVGNAVFGAGSAAASAWVQPLKDRLDAQGGLLVGPGPGGAGRPDPRDALGPPEFTFLGYTRATFALCTFVSRCAMISSSQHRADDAPPAWPLLRYLRDSGDLDVGVTRRSLPRHGCPFAVALSQLAPLPFALVLPVLPVLLPRRIPLAPGTRRPASSTQH